MARHNPAELVAGAVVLLVAAGFLGYAVAHTGRSAGGGTALHARFERIDGLTAGADVRIAGVKVGSVTGASLDPQTYQANVDFTVSGTISLPRDSSAAISTDGLLGGQYLSVVPGGDTATIPAGGTVTVTQSAINIQDLLGKFIFSAANLADEARKSKTPSATAKPGELPPPGKTP